MTMTTNQDFKAITEFDTELTAGSIKQTMASIGAKSSDLWKVPVGSIKILPHYNPRVHGAKYEAKIAWLTDQIMEHGFFADKPLAGYIAIEGDKQVIYLQDEHGRLEAVQRAIALGAPIEVVPMVLKDRSMSMLDLTIALVTSNEGEPFGPIEKAALVKRFRSFGKSDAEIATLMRCSPAYVGQLATLAGASRAIRDMVSEGEISATNAIESLRKHKEGAADVLGKAVAAAKTKGKAKASAKDDKAAALVARQRKLGPALFEVMGRYLDTAPNIPGPFSEEIDKIFWSMENDTKPEKSVKGRPVKVAKAKVTKAPRAAGALAAH